MAGKVGLPAGHPAVSQYVCRGYNWSAAKVAVAGECPTRFGVGHVDIDVAINDAAVVFPATHVKVQPLLSAWMPSSHG
jgi:hypothetical protein